jgi:hypothetical protein
MCVATALLPLPGPYIGKKEGFLEYCFISPHYQAVSSKQERNDITNAH